MNQVKNSRDIKLESELIAISYENLSSSIVASSLIAVVLVFGLWEISNPVGLLIWLVMTLGVSLWRYLNAKKYLKESSVYSVEVWKKRFYAGLVVHSILYTAFIILFFPQEDVVYQAFVTIMIIGLASGAVSSLSSYKQHIYTFILALLFPLAVVMVLQSHYLFTLLSTIVLLYIAMLSAMVSRFNKNLVQAIKNKTLFADSEKNLKRSEDRVFKIFEQAPVGIFTFDKELNILELNQELANILHVDYEQLIGLNLQTLSNEKIIQEAQRVLNGEDVAYESDYTTYFKKLKLYLSVRSTPLYNSDNEVESGLAIIHDITNTKLDAQKIQFLAYHDGLTGLANRTLLNDRLDYLISRASRHGSYSALMFIDLDHFKTINDSLGHHIGDGVLKTFTKRVKRIIRKEDTLARLGGDEFILLLSELSDNQLSAMNMAQEIAQKLHQATKEAYHVETHVLHVTASIGVTLIDASMRDKNDILKYADLAMYKAKEEGRDRTCFYEKEMDAEIKKRLRLENDLHEALNQKEFELHYHPIVSCSSDEVVCVEALLRYRKKEGTLIYPDEFIGVAEESGTIVAIGYWVIEEACRQLSQWHQKYGDAKLKNIAINISHKQFMQEDFVSRLSEIVSKYNIGCSAIELELTESVVIGDVDMAIKKMHELKRLGFILSMDDFGTGYSSLSYLKNLPFDIIKIDRSFMKNVLSNSDDALLVTTILSICEQFNLEVIAEGVETVEQIEFLHASSCDYYQGHVVTPPVPADEFEKFLH